MSKHIQFTSLTRGFPRNEDDYSTLNIDSRGNQCYLSSLVTLLMLFSLIDEMFEAIVVSDERYTRGQQVVRGPVPFRGTRTASSQFGPGAKQGNTVSVRFFTHEKCSLHSSPYFTQFKVVLHRKITGWELNREVVMVRSSRV